MISGEIEVNSLKSAQYLNRNVEIISDLVISYFTAPMKILQHLKCVTQGVISTLLYFNFFPRDIQTHYKLSRSRMENR